MLLYDSLVGCMVKCLLGGIAARAAAWVGCCWGGGGGGGLPQHSHSSHHLAPC